MLKENVTKGNVEKEMNTFELQLKRGFSFQLTTENSRSDLVCMFMFLVHRKPSKYPNWKKETLNREQFNRDEEKNK